MTSNIIKKCNGNILEAIKEVTEKGSFFDGVVHVNDGSKFDPKKLKITVEAQPNGDTNITEVEYNGETVDNNGGDTTGKGYYAAVWDW